MVKMATYKVLQDIEAEDKILGPLTLKQFVFAGVAIALGGVGYFIASNTHWSMFIPFLVPMIPFIFLAAPIGRDQPNDVWLAARLRFMFKPKVRTWDQTGMQEFVTITAPKREVHIYTDGLDRDQVVSRLKALANTVDSRGWAIKNVNLNVGSVNASPISDDRLVKPAELPQDVQTVDIHASDDMLDTDVSSVSQHFQQLIDNKEEAARLEAIATMNQPQVAAPQTNDKKELSDDEKAFLDKLHEQQDHLGIRQDPSHDQASLPTDTKPEPAARINDNQPKIKPVKRPVSAAKTAIIDKYKDEDVLSVATIAEQAKRISEPKPEQKNDNDGFEVSLR